ncbi:olfactory receptor 14A2-like [Trichosurus vulpecula]|uniref:olfactory receptor 14A2-like n=1 Tax=Trichosurus vulpecula TaxID=9337 RepID=UPI00186B0962|nr:olfactory receptor 14A2-like [Trichosurus vulpecula]
MVHLFLISVQIIDRTPPSQNTDNLTMVTGFYLMGFSNTWELQVLHAMSFLLIYLVALIGNLLIFILITLDGHLHTPMYFFLKNLSFLDLCFISVTVSKSIENSLSRSCSISFFGCVLQVFLVVLFAGSEILLLMVMSYDRYIAICQPLHYETIMNKRFCRRMATSSWLIGGLLGAMYSGSTFSLPFCGPKEIHQFFCDVPSLLKISCAETHIAVDVSVAFGITLGIFCCISIAISYGHIFSTVLKIPTTEGRSKAFSTCLPHLIVLMVFITTGIMSYIKPPLDSDSVLDLSLSMLYTVAPPTLNPVNYSLRNRDMKMSLMKLLTCKHFS